MATMSEHEELEEELVAVYQCNEMLAEQCEQLQAENERLREEVRRLTAPLTPAEMETVARVTSIAAQATADETPATRVRPNGPEDAQVRIAAAVREIEIICDEFGFDPVQWLMPNLENDMPGDAVSENASHE